ncbi:MAG: KH domain-containing protein [Eggerthellaceae bacterium]|nr:KH domain-containing protein [Eggerthellaceae bacterium]
MADEIEQEAQVEVEEVLEESEEQVEEIAEEASEDAASDDLISEEELDQIADTAIAALEDILKYFNLGEVTIDEYEGDEGELILDITGDDLAVLIGRHGKTLDALQFLISSITSRQIGYRYPVVVDVEGYKNRQREKLESLAHSAAKRALSQGRSIKLRPMTPYERRIIHMALRDNDQVDTGSQGEGAARHVVITPID